ncbi:MAG: FtsW/RodA/SpoVE family cell cycle protein, partial [Chloroflexi bacterium]|nr:FtsW/RodA/SpoVE family cell cycle protein [Chloroflexota bacterium]
MVSTTLERLPATKIKTLRHNLDYPLLVTVAVLVIFGVVMVYSSSYVVAYRELDDPHYFFVRQVVWVGLGMILMLALSRVPYHWWAKWATPGLVIIVIALLVTQFTPLGVDYGGAR